MRATPRQSGPCWLAFLWKRGTCPLHPEPLGVSVWSDGPAVHASPDRLLSGLVEGTVPGTGKTGATKCRTSSSSPATSVRSPKCARPKAVPRSPTSPWPPRGRASRKAEPRCVSTGPRVRPVRGSSALDVSSSADRSCARQEGRALQVRLRKLPPRGGLGPVARG